MSIINDKLQEEYDRVQSDNNKSLSISGVILILFGGYLMWVNSQLNILLDPDGMAEAATGIALENIPEISKTLSNTIQETTPAMARQASQEVIEIVPLYRIELERHIKPIIDEVTIILADASIESAIASIDKAGSANSAAQAAASTATDAVIAELDGVLLEALQQKGDDGSSPQDAIDKSLTALQTVNSELKKMQQGGGDPQERELLMTWLNIISQP